MNIERSTAMHIGCSYVGSKQIFRIVVGPQDYRPLCFHYHDTAEEAKECKLALEHYQAGTMPPFPVDEPKKSKRKEEPND